MRTLRRLFLAAIILLPAFGLLCQWLVLRAAHGRTYDSVSAIPPRRVGLLLGTNPQLASGEPNAFFDARIDAAVALFHAGKIERLLLSGNGLDDHYNEPAVMKQRLLARGIPAGAITLDPAGLRTLDSVIRAQKVFGLREFTLISQKFHNERALLIARHAGLDAIAFNAEGVALQTGAKVYGREIGARILAVLDLYFLKTKPQVTGAKIPPE